MSWYIFLAVVPPCFIKTRPETDQVDPPTTNGVTDTTVATWLKSSSSEAFTSAVPPDRHWCTIHAGVR